MTDARVMLWGSQIGAISWLNDREIGIFQYEPNFLNSGMQLSPLMMPLNEFPYEFPNLPRNTFRGLPGLLADSLPDKFGNSVIDAWLASEGRTTESFNSVERLCYVGSRGMGALEYEPAILRSYSKTKEIEVDRLVKLVNRILDQRKGLGGVFTGDADQEEMEDILRVGTSAGGARAKAILAWNSKTNEFRSGQIDIEPGFENWILKFDGISNNRDKELSDPQGYGKIEYAYYLMALEVGIEMMPSRLHHEGGRSHFMTKRFDRNVDGGKLHMQSLGAIAHFDYNQPASYSYEEAIQIMKRLELPREDLEQQVLRAILNVVGRNQDDHVKNIAFLMNRRGEWRLSPAFDVIYSFAPRGDWTSKHQMSINGKRDMFQREDLVSLAEIAGIKARRTHEVIDHVIAVVRRWEDFAYDAKVDEARVPQIQATHRISF